MSMTQKITCLVRHSKKLIGIILFSVFLLPSTYSQKISKSVRVSAGAVNGVLIEKNGKKLVVYGDPDNELKKADLILFTHFRRDVIWAGRNLVAKGSPAVVPAGEKSYFISGDSIWSQFTRTRFHDFNNQTTKIGFSPVIVSRFVQGGETVRWQDIDFKVLDTPGYTRGSVSYIADIDQKRYAFVGDLIYGDGKILDLYSFQDSLGSVAGYHGYGARLGQLISSLQHIAAQKPDFLIPSRGPVIKDPASSIQKLINRVRSVYRNYLSVSAYRWYNPNGINSLSNHISGPSASVDFMQQAKIEKNPPSWYAHFSNSNIVFAQDSTAFLIDYGLKSAKGHIEKLKNSRRLKSINGIFITHYHDDHTNFINDLVKEFKCPVYTTKELKDILENPAAYRMPCLTTDPIHNLIVMQEGQKMKWKDFTLTFHYFPGQTLYHSSLLFEKDNKESIFFIGDSFTPTGMDDYCLLNRNFLHPGTGYLYCLDLLKKLPSNVLLANQHVEPLFAFSWQQLDHMTKTLVERNALLKELFPWDNINYGVDEQWVSVYPYGQKATPGQTVEYTVKVFNHSDRPNTFQLAPDIPDGFTIEPKFASFVIAPRAEGEMTFKVKVPEEVSPGIILLTFDIKFDKWDLREWSEGILEASMGKHN